MESGFTQRGLRGSCSQISRGGSGFADGVEVLEGSSTCCLGVIVDVLLRRGVRVAVVDCFTVGVEVRLGSCGLGVTVEVCVGSWGLSDTVAVMVGSWGLGVLLGS